MNSGDRQRGDQGPTPDLGPAPRNHTAEGGRSSVAMSPECSYEGIGGGRAYREFVPDRSGGTGWGEGSQGDGETVITPTFESSAGGDDELMASLDDDTGCAPQALKEPSVFVVWHLGKASRFQVDAGPYSEVGPVYMVVRSILQNLLAIFHLESLAQLGAALPTLSLIGPSATSASAWARSS